MNRYGIALKKPSPIKGKLSFHDLVQATKIGGIYHVVGDSTDFDYLGVLRGHFPTTDSYRWHMAFDMLATREWRQTIPKSFYIYSRYMKCIHVFEEIQPADLGRACKPMYGIRKEYYKLLHNIAVEARAGKPVSRYDIMLDKAPPIQPSFDTGSILSGEPGARYKIAVSNKNKPDAK